MSENDSKTLHAAIHSAKTVQEKRLRVDISSIQELIAKKLVSEVRWVDTKSQIADNLTKKSSDGKTLLEILWKNSLNFP